MGARVDVELAKLLQNWRPSRAIKATQRGPGRSTSDGWNSLGGLRTCLSRIGPFSSSLSGSPRPTQMALAPTTTTITTNTTTITTTALAVTNKPNETTTRLAQSGGP